MVVPAGVDGIKNTDLVQERAEKESERARILRWKKRGKSRVLKDQCIRQGQKIQTSCWRLTAE